MVQADSPVAALAGAADEATLESLVAEYPDDISAITDDAPFFFWHFTPFTDVAGGHRAGHHGRLP
ncbi:MAG: hypothetical protein R2789_10305 [Microthrixaceae bacterium]